MIIAFQPPIIQEDTTMPQRRCLFTIVLFMIVTIGLAGCNDEKNGQAAQSAAEQIEINKSNGYITAANVSGAAFGKALSSHIETISPKLESDRAIRGRAGT